MGQRSQIYVRYPKDENGEGAKKGLIAKYFGWNYGERMVSRARHGIEYLTETFLGRDYNRFRIAEYADKVSRVFDTNFDMQDVAISGDIIKEWNELFAQDDFNACVFYQQDNNNGKLFVDVSKDGIKYCFTDREIKMPMSA